MRCSTIAVCLLVVFPGAVSACIEETPVQGEWFYKQQSSRPYYSPLAESMETDDPMMVTSVIAGGAGAAILLGLLIRAAWRSRRQAPLEPPERANRVPLALPFDRPEGFSLRIDQGHDESSPSWTNLSYLEQNHPLQTAEA